MARLHLCKTAGNVYGKHLAACTGIKPGVLGGWFRLCLLEGRTLGGQAATGKIQADPAKIAADFQQLLRLGQLRLAGAAALPDAALRQQCADAFLLGNGQKFQIHAPQKAAQPVQQHKKQADARQNAGAAQQSLC